MDKFKLPAIPNAILIVALMAIIFAADASSGTEISLSIFYLIPIAIATWSYGRTTGLALSLVCAILWLLGEVVAGKEYSNAVIPFWNMLVRLGFFVIVTLTLATRKRIEAELIGARHEAVAANRAKTEFVNRVTHELRTPLAAIVGFSDIMEKRSGPLMTQQDRDLLRRIRANGESLVSLVEGVLDVGRAQSDATTLKQTLDLSELITTTAADFEHRLRPGVELIVDVPPNLTIESDTGLLRQIVLNLISNAVKFTERGQIRIGVGMADGTRPVSIFVEDSGIGIPADRLQAIFLPFEQADPSIHSRFGGAGLGLTIARDLCHRLGCQLHVDTKVGTGSRFTIVLA
jgi:signal transduction histidine kinase